MRSHFAKFSAIATVASCLSVAACSSGSDSGPGTGQLSLSVSDSPVQAARQVCVEFAAAEFKMAGAENQLVSFDPPARIDLLAYQGMNAAPLFTNETLLAGEYQWVRLEVNASKGADGGAGAGSNDTECLGAGSYIVTDSGSVHNLYVPSGAQSGLKLNRGFTLPVGGNADFVAEFDLMASVHNPENSDPDYILRPTIHLLDRTETGSVAGEVSMTLATSSECDPAVYLFNAGVTPDDNEDDLPTDSVDPLGSAIVELAPDGRYLYEIGPVLAGDYELAFSCDADDPLVDDAMNFVLSADNPVNVVVGQAAVANF